MVSYYNPLSPAMFPNPPSMGVATRHHHQQTTAAVSAAAAAAGHAYFQNYHAHAAAAYGHTHNYGPYLTATSDLNSNMYNGGQTAPHFANEVGGWTPTATPSSGPAPPGSGIAPPTTGLGTPPNSWPSFGHHPVTSSSSTCNRFDPWPHNNSEDSPPTNSEANLPPGGRSASSPVHYGTTQSHSSGSPSGTPTPGVQAFHQSEIFNNGKFSNFGGNNQETQISPNGQCSMEPHSPPMNNHLGGDQQLPLASPVTSLASPPASRPQPARSPYEWMKKPSYQSQPEKSGEFQVFN